MFFSLSLIAVLLIKIHYKCFYKCFKCKITKKINTDSILIINHPAIIISYSSGTKCCNFTYFNCWINTNKNVKCELNVLLQIPSLCFSQIWILYKIVSDHKRWHANQISKGIIDSYYEWLSMLKVMNHAITELSSSPRLI